MCEWSAIECIIDIIRTKYVLDGIILNNIFSRSVYILVTALIEQLHCDIVTYSKVRNLLLSEWMENALLLAPVL